MDLLVFHSRFGDLSVELSASHVSCCYTFYFLFTFFFFFFPLPLTPTQLLGCIFTSLASIIPGSDEPTGGGKKWQCVKDVSTCVGPVTPSKSTSLSSMFNYSETGVVSFTLPVLRSSVWLLCSSVLQMYPDWICKSDFTQGLTRTCLYVQYMCTQIHRHTKWCIKDFTWERDERKVAAWRGRTETDWRQAEGNKKGIRGREGRVISGRIHYVVCVSLYHQTAYYVQVISSSSRFHKENPFTCAWMNQQLSLFRVAEPRKRVCFHFLYHVVLGSCLFSSSDAWKYCGQENRVQVFFLLRSLGVSPASDWSRDKHMSYISSGFAAAGSYFFFVLALPLRIKVNQSNWINIFDSNDCLPKQDTKQPLPLLKGSFLQHR